MATAGADLEDLALALSGEAVEELLDLAADPKGYADVGSLARVSIALKELADVVARAAKDEAEQRMIHGHYENGGVVFRWRDTHIQSRINTQEIKAKYPRERYPALYYDLPVAAAIVMRVKANQKSPASRGRRRTS